MLIGAEELVTSGGPSAPAWAFFTGISLAVLGILAQQLKSHSDLKQLKAQADATKDEAIKAHESASAAQANTVNVSNGFVNRLDRKLDAISKAQADTNQALREHLAWHLEKESK